MINLLVGESVCIDYLNYTKNILGMDLHIELE